MKHIVTERDRQQMFKKFMNLLMVMPSTALFPRYAREILADRLVEIAIAETTNKEAPRFPPEGFEAIFTTMTNPETGEKFAATMRRLVSPNDQSSGPSIEEST